MQLMEIDRCRTIYEKQIQIFPQNQGSWTDYAQFEAALNETERARAIYNLAIDQPQIDMPEEVWKSYIEFEIDQGENAKVRRLYV